MVERNGVSRGEYVIESVTPQEESVVFEVTRGMHAMDGNEEEQLKRLLLSEVIGEAEMKHTDIIICNLWFLGTNCMADICIIYVRQMCCCNSTPAGVL